MVRFTKGSAGQSDGWLLVPPRACRTCRPLIVGIVTLAVNAPSELDVTVAGRSPVSSTSRTLAPASKQVPVTVIVSPAAGWVVLTAMVAVQVVAGEATAPTIGAPLRSSAMVSGNRTTARSLIGQPSHVRPLRELRTQSGRKGRAVGGL